MGERWLSMPAGARASKKQGLGLVLALPGLEPSPEFWKGCGTHAKEMAGGLRGSSLQLCFPGGSASQFFRGFLREEEDPSKEGHGQN